MCSIEPSGIKTKLISDVRGVPGDRRVQANPNASDRRFRRSIEILRVPEHLLLLPCHSDSPRCYSFYQISPILRGTSGGCLSGTRDSYERIILPPVGNNASTSRPSQGHFITVTELTGTKASKFSRSFPRQSSGAASPIGVCDF